tara:strand:+ start:125 stop:241 length:117 start_codon:yes stop_codon:yes gene_type:complete
MSPLKKKKVPIIIIKNKKYLSGKKKFKNNETNIKKNKP